MVYIKMRSNRKNLTIVLALSMTVGVAAYMYIRQSPSKESVDDAKDEESKN
jgi:hypothetical protein